MHPSQILRQTVFALQFVTFCETKSVPNQDIHHSVPYWIKFVQWTEIVLSNLTNHTTLVSQPLEWMCPACVIFLRQKKNRQDKDPMNHQIMTEEENIHIAKHRNHQNNMFTLYTMYSTYQTCRCKIPGRLQIYFSRYLAVRAFKVSINSYWPEIAGMSSSPGKWYYCTCKMFLNW